MILVQSLSAQNKGGRWQFENNGFDTAGWDAQNDNGALQGEAVYNNLNPAQGTHYLFLDTLSIYDYFRIDDSNDLDFTNEDIMRKISDQFPGIESKDIQFLYHGTYNVYEVKGTNIFRFPDKSFLPQDAIQLIDREKETLEFLRAHIEFEIPKPSYVSLDPLNPYLGYKRIPGISLSRIFSQLSLQSKVSLGKQIGNFLTDLHSDRILELYENQFGNTFSFEDYQEKWRNLSTKVVNKLSHMFSTVQNRWIKGIFSDFLNQMSSFHFKPKLVHGDFDTSNILVNPQSNRLTGIIDFEEASIYDPAADFFFIHEGEEFLKAVLSTYQGEVDEHLGTRNIFYYNRAPLIYILTGIEIHKPKMVEAGVNMLHQRIKNGRDFSKWFSS